MRAAFPVCQSLGALLLAVLSGCASQPPSVAGSDPALIHSPVCDQSWQLDSAAPLKYSSKPLIQVFDASSACLAEPNGVAVTYAAYRLPNFQGPWQMRVESHIHGRSLFAPELILLDQDHQAVRRIPHQRFVMRGKQLQATIFFKNENAGEKFLLVRSASGVAGHGQVRVESSYFVLPIFTGIIPFVYMQGTEREREFVLSHSGVVKVYTEKPGRSANEALGYKLASR